MLVEGVQDGKCDIPIQWRSCQIRFFWHNTLGNFCMYHSSFLKHIPSEITVLISYAVNCVHIAIHQIKTWNLIKALQNPITKVLLFYPFNIKANIAWRKWISNHIKFNMWQGLQGYWIIHKIILSVMFVWTVCWGCRWFQTIGTHAIAS